MEISMQMGMRMAFEGDGRQGLKACGRGGSYVAIDSTYSESPSVCAFTWRPIAVSAAGHISTCKSTPTIELQLQLN